MKKTAFERLAHHLNQLPGGYPKTDRGVEIKILEKLFSEEDARIASHLTLLPEPPRVIARRAKIPVEDTRKCLEELSQRGCIFSVTTDALAESFCPLLPTWIKKKILFYGLKDSEKDSLLFAACNFVIGIWEFHLTQLDKALVEEMNDYMPDLIDEWVQAPQLRTIPIRKSLDGNFRVMDYEHAEKLIRKQKRLAVAECICRKETRIAGHGCKKPLETCLVFGMAADYYLRNKLGRIIDTQEALDILKKAENSGLVLQPTNAKEITNICCCCGCCCGVLRNVKKLPQPGRLVPSSYIADFQAGSCNGCGACVKRCPMDAFTIENKQVIFDQTRCIGCGICTVSCKTGSLTLIRRTAEEIPDIPGDPLREYFKASIEKGKRSRLGFIKLIAQSGMDRFLS